MKIMKLRLLLAGWCIVTAARIAAAAETSPTNNPAARTALETVIIVYKTHFDIGYTASAKEVVHDYRTEMTDRLLDAIEENEKQPRDKQFVWTLSGYPLQQILWDGQAPARRQKIEAAIREGNIAVHALCGSLHTETAGLEDLVRGGLGISAQLCRRYGRSLPISAKMSDVPGQSWAFPTIFAHAGIKFYHMGGPLVNLSFNLPPMFWWEGPDGSRLLTLYNNGYGSSQLPPAGWPYRTWVYICMTGDNQGPPDPGTVQKDLAFYAKRGITARVGAMDDFSNLILKEDLTQLPIVRSDIPDPWVHGVMSMPTAVKAARNHRLFLGTVEALTALESRCWDVFRPDIRDAIRTAYERSIRFSEHTFGLANQHYVKQPFGRNGADWDRFWAEGMSPACRLMEDSWNEKAQCVEDLRRLAADPGADAILTLGDSVAVNGGRVVVYNPLPWTRDGEVTLNCFHLPAGSVLKPVDGGPSVPVAFDAPSLEDNPSRVRRFAVKDIPSMGYRSYVFAQEATDPPALVADESSGLIESPFFRARLDAKRGRIVSLVDKRSGRELVDSAAPQGFGQYFYERFGYQQITNWLAASLYGEYAVHRYLFAAYDMPSDGVYASALPEEMSLTVLKTPIDVTAVMTGTLRAGAIGQEQKVSIRLTLPAALPVADLTVSWQKQPDGWPEAGWICLPFACAHPKFRVGRLGADVDPVADVSLDNVNYHNLFLETGAVVYDGETGAGVGLCALDSPMISLGEPGEYRFEGRYEPRKPYVYVNLYNNHWRTNFRGWIGQGERMESRLRLWAFDRYAAESALLTPSMETRVPLLAARSTSRPGKLPPTQAGIVLSRKGVLVTAFGDNPDGVGTLLRVWEQAGSGGDLTVALPGRFQRALPVNLRGESAGPAIDIKSGKLKLILPAYAPASFVLE